MIYERDEVWQGLVTKPLNGQTPLNWNLMIKLSRNALQRCL